MVLSNFDFWGSDEELTLLDKAMKKAVDKTEGVDLLGRYAPEALKWHWTYFYKTESLTTWENFLKNLEYKRDKKLIPHETTVFYV